MSNLKGVSKKFGDTGDLVEITTQEARQLRLWKNAHGQWILDFVTPDGALVKVDLTTHVITKTVCEPWVVISEKPKATPKRKKKNK